MFRASLVGGVGYCAKDRRRSPLSGSEQRVCWTGSVEVRSDGFFEVVQVAPPTRGLLEVKPGP